MKISYSIVLKWGVPTIYYTHLYYGRPVYQREILVNSLESPHFPDVALSPLPLFTQIQRAFVLFNPE